MIIRRLSKRLRPTKINKVLTNMEKNVKLNFKGVDSADSKFKAKIQPGVHKIKIINVSAEENDNGKVYISIKCENEAGTQEHEERMYISTEKGKQYTMGRLKHLTKKAIGKELDGDVTVAALNKALAGKPARVKFVAEEYEYQGDIKTKTSFAFQGFAEEVSIADENTALFYDPNNKYDYKKLARPEDQAINYDNEEATKDDFEDIF